MSQTVESRRGVFLEWIDACRVRQIGWNTLVEGKKIGHLLE